MILLSAPPNLDERGPVTDDRIAARHADLWTTGPASVKNRPRPDTP
jgi:hypothetical protein